MRLNELIENKDNPRKVSEEELNRLVDKLRRNEGGLKAMRIAYVVEDGQNIVISGNTRLKALAKIHGDDWEIPDEYIQDLTCLSEAEKHEFIIDANKSDGTWDLDRLLEQYDKDELKEYGLNDVLKLCTEGGIDDIPDDEFLNAPPSYQKEPKEEDEKEKHQKTITCPFCGKETPIK